MTKLMNIIKDSNVFPYCADKATFVNKHYIIKVLYQDINHKVATSDVPALHCCILTLLSKVITSMVIYLCPLYCNTILLIGKVDVNRAKISI